MAKKKINNLELKSSILYTYIYNESLYNILLIKLLNNLIVKGKKHKIEISFKKNLYNLQKLLKIKNKKYFLIYFFLFSLKNLMPLINIRKYKISQRSYYIPYIISLEKTRLLKGIKLLITSKDFSKELYESFYKNSNSYMKKLHLNELAYKNRAFIHYRWTL